jgi:hypothetical protein
MAIFGDENKREMRPKVAALLHLPPLPTYGALLLSFP